MDGCEPSWVHIIILREGRSVFFNDTIDPSRSTTPQTRPHTQGQYKLDLMGWWEKEHSSLSGQGGEGEERNGSWGSEYDQNTVYEILKELKHAILKTV